MEKRPHRESPHQHIEVSDNESAKTKEEMDRTAERMRVLRVEIDGVKALVDKEEEGSYKHVQLLLQLQQLWKQFHALKGLLDAEGNLYRLDSATEEGGSPRLQ